jgi:hypothetical protein
MYFPFESWVYGIERHFQQYFSYFVAVSFIGGYTVGTVPKSNGKIVEKKIDTLTHKNDH